MGNFKSHSRNNNTLSGPFCGKLQNPWHNLYSLQFSTNTNPRNILRKDRQPQNIAKQTVIPLGRTNLNGEKKKSIH